MGCKAPRNRKHTLIQRNPNTEKSSRRKEQSALAEGLFLRDRGLNGVEVSYGVVCDEENFVVCIGIVERREGSLELLCKRE